MKYILVNVFFVLLGVASIGSSAAEIKVTPANGSDCPSQGIIDSVLTKRKIQSEKIKWGSQNFFIKGFDCDSGPISVGINGESFLIKDYAPVAFGRPVLYSSGENDLSVYIEHVALILEDTKNAVSINDEEKCVPTYSKVKVTIGYKKDKKVIYGTAVADCP